MHKERILRLADRLDKVLPEHYDPSSWFSTPVRLYELIEKRVVKEEFGRTILLKEGFCGSVACTLGHAALIPEFIKDGLHISFGSDQTFGTVYYKNQHGNFAGGAAGGALFFDIPENHAEIMFFTHGNENITESFYGVDSASLVTPKIAAAALRKYVETDGENMEEAIIRFNSDEDTDEDDEDDSESYDSDWDEDEYETETEE